MLINGGNRLPSCGHYAMLLSQADKVTGSREKSREMFGTYTYKQWAEWLGENKNN